MENVDGRSSDESLVEDLGAQFHPLTLTRRLALENDVDAPTTMIRSPLVLVACPKPTFCAPPLKFLPEDASFDPCRNLDEIHERIESFDGALNLRSLDLFAGSDILKPNAGRMTSVSYDVLRDRLTVLPTPQLSQNVTCRWPLQTWRNTPAIRYCDQIAGVGFLFSRN